ncbi:MAG: DUF4339 domain-containing protein [Planctomycetaceae bacterium]
MAKPWYYQMMGAEIGPLTPAELKEKVQIGQIQPDTLVRSGSDGKWIPADRWKGLLPVQEAKPEPTPLPVEESEPATTTIPVNEEDDPLYHMKGEATAAGGPVPFSHPDEYDFFQFVGFRHAITHPLYDALVIYSHQHQLTVTQITRRAIAQFIGKPELGQDQPPPNSDATKTDDAT